MNAAQLILLILGLVEAGFRLDVLRRKVNEMEAAGASNEEVTAYLKGVRDVALKELDAVQ